MYFPAFGCRKANDDPGLSMRVSEDGEWYTNLWRQISPGHAVPHESIVADCPEVLCSIDHAVSRL
jgi:hypothetical protein